MASVSVWHKAWHTVNTPYRELSLSIKNWLMSNSWAAYALQTETERNPYIKVVSAFWCCIKYSALTTDVSLSCPDYSRIGIWKREVSAENNLGRKILNHCAAFSICPPDLIQILPHFLTTLNEVKHNILFASGSQGRWLWDLFCYHWTVLTNVQISVMWGWNECSNHQLFSSEMVPSLHPVPPSCVKTREAQPHFQD